MIKTQPFQKLPEYSDYADILRNQDPTLAEEIKWFHGIEQVLNWMNSRNLGQATIDMVGQDEFEYDFLIELEPDGRWIIFGVT